MGHEDSRYQANVDDEKISDRTLLDKIASNALRERADAEDIDKHIREHRLRRFEQLERMDVESLLKVREKTVEENVRESPNKAWASNFKMLRMEICRGVATDNQSALTPDPKRPVKI